MLARPLPALILRSSQEERRNLQAQGAASINGLICDFLWVQIGSTINLSGVKAGIASGNVLKALSLTQARDCRWTAEHDLDHSQSAQAQCSYTQQKLDCALGGMYRQEMSKELLMHVCLP